MPAAADAGRGALAAAAAAGRAPLGALSGRAQRLEQPPAAAGMLAAVPVVVAVEGAEEELPAQELLAQAPLGWEGEAAMTGQVRRGGRGRRGSVVWRCTAVCCTRSLLPPCLC
jgi:hypothetical protein